MFDRAAVVRWALLVLCLFVVVSAFSAQAQPVRLVEDLSPGTGSQFLGWTEVAELGDGRILLFTSVGELWVSDGMLAGSERIADGMGWDPSTAFPDPAGLVGAGDGFVVFETFSGHWVTDGTRAGTHRIPLWPYFEVRGVVGSKVLFASRVPPFDMASYDVVRRSISRSASAAYYRQGVTLGDRLVGQVFFPGVGTELGVSDGTVAGTRLLADLETASNGSPQAHGSYPHLFTVWGDRVLFVATTEEGRALYVTDGTAAGTRRILGDAGPVRSLVLDPLADRVALMTDQSVWVSNGTADGTRELDLGGAEPISSLVWSGEKLYFTANDGEHGRELWIADPEAGTGRMVADFEPGRESADLEELAPLSESGLYFTVGDLYSNKKTPWSTRGDAESTAPYYVETLEPERLELIEERPEGLLVGVYEYGRSGLYLLRRDGLDRVYDLPAAPLHRFDDGATLLRIDDYWQSRAVALLDGVSGSVEPLPGLEPEIAASTGIQGTAALGDQLVYLALESRNEDWSLRSTDGDTDTDGSTGLPGSFGYRPELLGVTSEAAFYRGNFDDAWATDGTDEGTVRLGDWDVFDTPILLRDELCRLDGPELTCFDATGRTTLSALPDGTTEEIAVGGERLYLLVETDEGGLDVWSSNGTSGGAERLFPAPAGTERFAWHRGSLYFLTREADDRRGLWWTERPQVEAPRRLMEHVDPSFSGGSWTASVGDLLFFGFGSRFEGRDLWVTDGTSAGTLRLLASGVGHVSAGEALLAFRFETETEPSRLWVSDGTHRGTLRIDGATELFEISVPAPVGDRFVFAGRDLEHGEEPWVTDGTPAGTRLVADIDPGPGSSAPRSFVATDDQLFFAAFDPVHGRELRVVSLDSLEAGPPPPAGAWLETAQVPGFRFKVRITDSQGGVTLGAREAGCIDETLCVSGALAGRSEVFARIVGPKPNGFLWPTLAKFTTSRVEVWVERTADGLGRYYLLPGATAGGADTLPALFDRGGFPVAGLVARESGPPIPPGSSGIVSPEVPGFRFHVRLTRQTGEDLPHREEIACIAETVCVSGAVPGRSELFLRVIGPRPNGMLWPTLVRFTTSRAEVWVEQLSSGAVRYYDLPAASPGDDRLDGLFDRGGFTP